MIDYDPKQQLIPGVEQKQTMTASEYRGKTNNLQKYQALGRMKAGVMNKTEKRYSELLEARKKSGDVLWWKFDALSLRLGDNLHYKPDFLVLTAESALECHETKGGYITEDGNMKIKMAAAIYPFRFLMQKWVKGKWDAIEY